MATTHSLKFPVLVEVQRALETLGQQQLPVSYEIARNLKSIRRVVDEQQEIARSLYEKFADKEDDGSLKRYVVGEQMKLKISDPKLFIAYNLEVKKIDETEHEVTLYPIAWSKIEKFDLQGNAIAPLLDIIIIDQSIEDIPTEAESKPAKKKKNDVDHAG